MPADPRMRRKRFQVESTDEAIVLVPFSFTVNGTSNADGLSGDSLLSAAFAETGEYLLTFREKGAVCLAAVADCSQVADDVDMYVRCDWSDYTANGQVTVRCMTGASETNLTDNTVVGGLLVVKKTTRRARG